jgi:hypothetical protein
MKQIILIALLAATPAIAQDYNRFTNLRHIDPVTGLYNGGDYEPAYSGAPYRPSTAVGRSNDSVRSSYAAGYRGVSGLRSLSLGPGYGRVRNTLYGPNYSISYGVGYGPFGPYYIPNAGFGYQGYQNYQFYQPYIRPGQRFGPVRRVR